MKKYIVTGACGGMGRAVCRKLTEAGCEIWGLDRALPETAAHWTPVQADLTRPDDLDRAFRQIRQEAGHLDGIIHLAGIYDLESFVEISPERFQQIFDVNVKAAYLVNRTFLPLLNRGSRIVLTTSELAPLNPLPFTGIYAVTKAALDKYADSLRMEVQLLGHQVIVLRPGAVRTGLLDVSTRRLDEFCESTKLYTCNAARFRAIVNRVEARSIAPEDIAKLVLKVLRARHPRYVYPINRNPLLLLLNALPRRMQTAIIRRVLRP